MKSLSEKIMQLSYEIAGDIDLGECFYNEEYLDDFCDKLRIMKILAVELYNKNKKENETDICKCDKAERILKLVEGNHGFVKDVYCSKCDKPIYP